MAYQHHRTWCGAGGSPLPGPRCVRHYCAPNGVALCCDATLVSTLTRNGQPAHAADSRDGAALSIAKRRRAARYPEISGARPRRAPAIARASRRGQRPLEQRGPTVRASTRPAQGAPRNARLARSSCTGLGAPLVEHSGCRGPACCLQRCAGIPLPITSVKWGAPGSW